MAGEVRRRRLRALLELAHGQDYALEAFEQAFTHASATRERVNRSLSNERLEFLGDAVLGFLTASWLYERFPDAAEGELARRKAALASDEAIADTARRLGFGELLILGRGERFSGGSDRSSNLGDAFEAFVAAVYRIAGMDAARHFVEQQHLEGLVDHLGLEADAKTALQELTQARCRATPTYLDDGEEGPDHERIFRARVMLGERILASGVGRSKKAAQQAAAAAALHELREEAR